MSFKVEITPIPNSNKNQVASYNETKPDLKNPKRTLNRTFIVPKENTDEFVTQIKKSEKNKLITVGLSVLAGAGITLGAGLKHMKNIDGNFLGWITVIAGLISGLIPIYIVSNKEQKLFQKLNVEEIKS